MNGQRASLIPLLRSHALRFSSLLSYALTCLVPLGASAAAAAGAPVGFASGALAWPYPLLLPLRPFFAWFGPLELWIADAFGAAGVYALARYLEHRLSGGSEAPAPVRFAVGLVGWPFFVAALNGFFYITGSGQYGQIP